MTDDDAVVTFVEAESHDANDTSLRGFASELRDETVDALFGYLVFACGMNDDDATVVANGTLDLIDRRFGRRVIPLGRTPKGWN